MDMESCQNYGPALCPHYIMARDLGSDLCHPTIADIGQYPIHAQPKASSRPDPGLHKIKLCSLPQTLLSTGPGYLAVFDC